MRKILLMIIVILAIIFLLGYKEKDKPRISEKDLLKIHISGKRTR